MDDSSSIEEYSNIYPSSIIYRFIKPNIGTKLKLNFERKYDIIFLTESWLNYDSEIHIPGFDCFNFYRKFKHRRAKRKSGGIICFIKQCVSSGISVVKNHF